VRPATVACTKSKAFSGDRKNISRIGMLESHAQWTQVKFGLSSKHSVRIFMLRNQLSDYSFHGPRRLTFAFSCLTL